MAKLEGNHFVGIESPLRYLRWKVKRFSTSCLLVSHSLPSWCSLVPLCYVFTWKLPTLMSIFLWSFIIVHQSQMQVVLNLLWSLIIIHQSKQHKPNVVGVIWECSVVVDLIAGRVLVAWVERITCLEFGVAASGCWRELPNMSGI